MMLPPKVITDKKQVFDGISYYLCGEYLQRDGVRLHRIVFESFKGPIPRGMHVHHIDENKMNNHPDNLELMQPGQHTIHHHKGVSRPMHENALSAAAEWHASEDGLKWHRENYQKTKHLLHRDITTSCSQCGKDFTARDTGTNKFCSAYCCSKHRRESGVDNETRTCEFCGNLFIVNRYRANKFCSRTCSSRKNAEIRSTSK